MKKQLVFCILTLGIATSAFAAPACTQGSLASYIAEGSCSVGNFTFNNFSYLAVNVLTAGASAADITVNATVGANGPNVTFTPDAALQATGLVAAAEYIFGFEVTSNIANIGFQSVQLAETGSVTGLSTAAVAEVDCYGGLLQLPNVLTGIVGLGCLNSGVAAGANASLPLNTTGTVNANIVFNGFSTTVDVLKDVTLAGILGSSQVTGIGQSFTTKMGGSAVPEPTTFFLGGCGLIGIGFIRRRVSKGGARTHNS